ncbi:MAG TPA: RNA ligase family protein, partial [Tepidisphaeraceae bacterium]|nr:RNA ligase family protein [Tepidisphaeraceae bacterium]
MPATLLDFARVNDAAAATTKKLQKQQILADYLRELDESDLRLAVRYAAGRALATTDQRVLGVSGAIVSEVILKLYAVDPREYHTLILRFGEIGDALSHIVSIANSTKHNGVMLSEISTAFDELSATGNLQNKRTIVRDLLARCTEPREAAYLVKIIFSDLRTGAREGILQAAIAQTFGATLLEIQRCQLLVGDLEQVALLAKRGQLQTATFNLFHPIQFMLATPQESAQEAIKSMDGKPFFAEDKLDGIRAQIHKNGDRIAIYTRTMDRADESFPDVLQFIRNLPGEFLLDGEIVPWKNGVVLPFSHLQTRLGRKELSAKIIADNPVAFTAFDLLYKDGELLIERPLRERRKLLESMQLLTTRIVEVSSVDQIDQAFGIARESRNEGLVLKDPDSIYAPGRRGKSWLKLKTHLPTFDCVVTAAEYGHGKRRGVLSDYTFAVWDGEKLVNIGKAYSGV